MYYKILLLGAIGAVALMGAACASSLSNSATVNQPIVGSDSDKTVPPPAEDDVPLESGIRGTVYLSPVCPVEKYPPDPNCKPRPTSLTIYIEPTAPTGKWFTVDSGTDGKYSVSVAPGKYTLSSTPPGYLGGPMQRYPSFGPLEVVVRANAYTGQDIQADSGIR